MQRFENKVVLITGAASGIGRATAQHYAAEGASLFLCDINAEGLHETVASLGVGDDAVLAHPLDVCDSGACRAAVDEAVKTFGRLDVLCNIAGVAMTHHFDQIADEEWSKIFDINVASVFYLSRAAIPHLKASGGNILNMGSISGLMGQAYTSAYCATKGAVVQLTRSLAIEYAKQGVRVNAVCPGGVKTALSANFTAPADVDFELMARYSPLVDMAEAGDIARAVLFLTSDEARHINGVALPIDDGVTAG